MSSYWLSRSESDREFFLTKNVDARYKMHITKWADNTLPFIKTQLEAKLEKLNKNPLQNQSKIDECSKRVKNVEAAIIALRAIVLSNFKDYTDTIKLKQVFWSFKDFHGDEAPFANFQTWVLNRHSHLDEHEVSDLK